MNSLSNFLIKSKEMSYQIGSTVYNSISSPYTSQLVKKTIKGALVTPVGIMMVTVPIALMGNYTYCNYIYSDFLRATDPYCPIVEPALQVNKVCYPLFVALGAMAGYIREVYIINSRPIHYDANHPVPKLFEAISSLVEKQLNQDNSLSRLIKNQEDKNQFIQYVFLGVVHDLELAASYDFTNKTFVILNPEARTNIEPYLEKIQLSVHQKINEYINKIAETEGTDLSNNITQFLSKNKTA